MHQVLMVASKRHFRKAGLVDTFRGGMVLAACSEIAAEAGRPGHSHSARAREARRWPVIAVRPRIGRAIRSAAAAIASGGVLPRRRARAL